MGRAGLLKDDTTYIHCTTLSDDEIQMVADTGGTVSLSAPVEMMMGHGMPPIQRFLDRGLRPSLSVDVETNMPNDMFTQMRAVNSLQKGLLFEKKLAHKGGLPAFLTSRDVIEFATVEGARANGLLDKTGTLTPGKQADLILLRTDSPNILPVNDPISAVTWGMDTSNVDSVFVAGKALKRNGNLLNVNLDDLREKAYQSRDYVISQSGFKLPEI
jgi:cytosine/adenosine deaminase-related metal-dependent hydrolase